MNTKHPSVGIRAALAAGTVALSLLPQVATAASSWAPTLLVNTEAFQTIDEGDGSTNMQVRFGQTLQESITYDRTNRWFQFSRGISVGGNITGTGSLYIRGLMSGTTLYTRGAATVGGALSVTGAITGQASITAKGALSGASVRISGNGEVHGALTASGAFRTDSNITINDDADTNDAVLTFGNNTANQTLKYLNSSQKFQMSKGLSVLGNLSGSTLNVDGNANVRGSLSGSGTIRTDGNLSGNTLNVDGTFNWRGITYTAPTSQSANTYLKTDGNGALSWSSVAVGNGSGQILSFHPEYPNAVYFSSGSTYVGQMTASGGTSAVENAYVWTSTRAALQDYWISVRVRVPDNFSSWDIVKPIQLRYKTGVASASNNHVTVRMKDTAGSNVTLSNGGALSGTSWATASITGPEAGGTWTPKSYFTLYIKLAANSTAGANAAAGFLNLNYETTTP